MLSRFGFHRRRHAKSYQVHLLNGDVQHLELEGRVNGEEVLSRVLADLGVEERQFFGLSVPDGHQLKWIALHKTAKKQIPGHSPYTLYLRVRLYPKTHCNLHQRSRHQLFLQVRQDLRDHRLRCNNAVLTQLTALAVQADIGDYSQMCGTGYLAEVHNLPKLNSQLQEAVSQLHRLNRGKSAEVCEEEFLDIAQEEPSYGVTMYPMQDSRGHQVTLALAPSGVKVQRGTIESGTFEWESIVNVTNKGKNITMHMIGTAGSANYQTTFGCSSSNLSHAIASSMIKMQTFYCTMVEERPKSRLKRFFSSRRSLRHKERQVQRAHTHSGNLPSMPTKRQSTSSLTGVRQSTYSDVVKDDPASPEKRNSSTLQDNISPPQHTSTPSHHHVHTSSTISEDSSYTQQPNATTHHSIIPQHSHPHSTPVHENYPWASHPPHIEHHPLSPSNPSPSHPPLPENPYPHLSHQRDEQQHNFAQSTTPTRHNSTYSHPHSQEHQQHSSSTSKSSYSHSHRTSPPRESSRRRGSSSSTHQTPSHYKSKENRHQVSSPPSSSSQFYSHSTSALPQNSSYHPPYWKLEEDQQAGSQPQQWELEEELGGKSKHHPPHSNQWESDRGGGSDYQHDHLWEYEEDGRQPQAHSHSHHWKQGREGYRYQTHSQPQYFEKGSENSRSHRYYWDLGGEGERKPWRNGLRPQSQQWEEGQHAEREREDRHRHRRGSHRNYAEYTKEELSSLPINGFASDAHPESREEQIARAKAKSSTYPAKPQNRGRHRLSLQESNYYANSKFYSKQRARQSPSNSQMYEGSLSQDRQYRGMRSLGSIASLEIRMSLAELSQASTSSTTHLDPHARSFVFESTQNDTATEL